MSSTVRTKKSRGHKNEIWKMFAQEYLICVSLLVFTIKQDIGLLSEKEVISKMELETLKGRSLHCQGSSALNVNGLTEGFTLLINKIEEFPKRNACPYKMIFSVFLIF